MDPPTEATTVPLIVPAAAPDTVRVQVVAGSKRTVRTLGMSNPRPDMVITGAELVGNNTPGEYDVIDAARR